MFSDKLRIGFQLPWFLWQIDTELVVFFNKFLVKKHQIILPAVKLDWIKTWHPRDFSPQWNLDFNEPLYSKVPSITKRYSSARPFKMYGREPRYNEAISLVSLVPWHFVKSRFRCIVKSLHFSYISCSWTVASSLAGCGMVTILLNIKLNSDYNASPCISN